VHSRLLAIAVDNIRADLKIHHTLLAEILEALTGLVEFLVRINFYE